MGVGREREKQIGGGTAYINSLARLKINVIPGTWFCIFSLERI